MNLSARANTVEEQSDSIVVSFSAEWYPLFLGRKFKAILRKRIPRTVHPRLLYFHINAPVSAICGRAKIESMREISFSQATALSNELALAPAEITTYLADQASVGCYKVSQLEFAQSPVTIKELESKMVYHAPQSFFILSQTAKALIDKLAKF
jgi:predicted transcriptional regulator